MSHRLIVPDSLRDFLVDLSPVLKKKIKSAFFEIINDPFSGKALVGKLEGYRSYKIKKIRIIYKIEGHSITILTAGPRESVYEQLILELRHRNDPRV